MSWLDTVKDGSAHEEIDDLSADLLSLTETVIAGSLLLGYGHAQEKTDFADDTEPVVFEEALRFLQGKIPMPKEEWKKLEPKMRFRAFTVARLAQLDYIESLRGRLTHAVKKGETWAQSWQDVKAIAEADGAAIKPGYWETVYRTNVQTAYNAGRLMQYEYNPPQAWQLLVIEDTRTSTICRPLAAVFRGNNALPASHEFWKTYGFPPYHFNCRTVVRAVHKQEAGRETAIENIPMKTIRKQFRPQAGFGGNPAENGNWWMLTEGHIKRGIKYGIIGEFNREENVIADYESLWEGYTRYNGKKGGWYDKHQNPAKDWKKNKPAIEFLANNGYKLKVPPELKNIKEHYKTKWSNPDVFINGEFMDIKQPDKMTSNAVKGRLASAWKRQRITKVVLYIPDEMPEAVLMQGIRRQANEPYNKITDVIVIYKGKISTLKMSDFKGKKAE